MKKILLIAPLLFMWTSFMPGSDGTPSPRSTLNLGATPWKFIRMVNDDVAAGKPMKVWGTGFPYVIDVNLQTDWDLRGFKDVFSNPAATAVNYTLAGSPDGKTWTMLVDKKDPAKAEKPAIQEATKSEKIENGTVGFVTHPVTASIEAEFRGNFQYLQLKIYDCRDGAGQSVPPGNHVFSAFSAESSAGDMAASADEGPFSSPDYDDSKWKSVAVPHCVDAMGTYLNIPYNNNPAAAVWRGTVWYRKHLQLNAGALRGKKAWLEFDSVSIAAAVYVNGKFKPGNSAVPQPGQVTHVGEFLPFAVDVTDDLKPGDNVIAVRVSNANGSFFTWPGFATNEGFFDGLGGINGPVCLRLSGKVSIPPDDYSTTGKWGTYIGTVAADSTAAQERVITQVENIDKDPHEAQLSVQFMAPDGHKALELDASKTIQPGAMAQFDLSGTIPDPRLWFPNNSPYGHPTLYKVVQTVRVNGAVTDSCETKTGLRTISWDGDHCFVNGKMHLMRGFGHHNAYPGFGSAVPENLQWKDIEYIAQCGGNAVRTGIIPFQRSTIEACDELGVLAFQNSGDNEWALQGEPAKTYKREYDRDLIVTYRNHPSIAVWESNNGLAHGADPYLPSSTQAVVDEWDPIWPRIVATRDGYPPGWDASRRVMVTYTNEYAKVSGSPSIDVEVYGANWHGAPCFNMERFDYANEKTFTDYYVNNFCSNVIDGKACGWLDWMLEETQGEGYTIYLDGKRSQKSLGSCAMDGNRFPKLKYRVYENALWIDYATRPGVALQSSWNLSGIQDVDAWSNCPQVELFLNGRSLGIRKPDARTKRCTWKGIQWEAGTLKAAGLDANGVQVCQDTRVTAGAPARILLTVEPRVRGPVKADGSDGAIITATIVDMNGNWCPDASNELTFAVTGQGNYLGSYNFLVQPGGKHQYAPGAPILLAEGGLMRVAVQSTFTPGRVTVTAQSKGLQEGTVSFETEPPAN